MYIRIAIILILTTLLTVFVQMPFEVGAQSPTLKNTVEVFIMGDATIRAQDVFACGTNGCAFSVSVPESSPTYREAIVEISVVVKGDGAALYADLSTGADCTATPNQKSYNLSMAAQPRTFTVQHGAGGVIVPATTAYRLCTKITGGTATDAMLFSAKLILTYEYTVSQQLRTAEFFMTQETASLADGTFINVGNGRDFQVKIVQSGVTVKSAFVEVDGITLSSSSGSGQLQVAVREKIDPAPATCGSADNFACFNYIPSAGTSFPAQFHVLLCAGGNQGGSCQVTGDVLKEHFPGLKDYTFWYRADGAAADTITTYILSAKLVITYFTVAGFPAFGDVISSTFDTQGTKGVAYNSILWKGNELALTDVCLQLATAASSGGPWTYQGASSEGSPCNASTWFTVASNDPFDLRGCAGQFNNTRYFKYKVRLRSGTAGGCTGSDQSNNTPRVDDVVVNYSW